MDEMTCENINISRSISNACASEQTQHNTETEEDVFGTMVRVRHAAIAAAAAAAASLVAVMDANPSLYFYDKLFVTESRRQHYFGGQRIWVTGASSGIGAKLAQELAASGARLVLSSRNSHRLENVAEECRKRHPNGHIAQVVPLDVCCSQEELENAVDLVLQDGQEVDCVILNAGMGQLSPVLQTPRETAEQLMHVNALGPMAMATLLLKKTNWQSKKRGHLVVTSSVAAKGGVPLSAAYAASKHAIHGYMLSLQAEHPWLRISLPCPGPVATNFHKTLPAKGEMKMSVERCVRLLMSSIMLGSSETWIAQQPTLGFMFISQYAPGLARRILNAMGPIRVGMWEAGLNVYDPKDMREYRRMQKNEK